MISLLESMYSVGTSSYGQFPGTDIRTGHFYFTKLLLPALLAVVQSSDGAIKARVVNTASVATELNSKLDYEAFKDGPVRKKMGTEPMYYQSKFVRSLIRFNSVANVSYRPI